MSSPGKVQIFHSQPYLEQIEGVGKGRFFDMSLDKIHLGRSEENEIVLSHDSVSRVHAIIEKNDLGKFLILDNESKNGVVVNGVKVEAGPIKEGDIIQIGNFIFKFSAGLNKLQSIDIALEPGEEQPFKTAQTTSLLKNKRVLMYGGVGLLVVFVLLNYKSEDAAPTDKKVVDDIKKNEKNVTASPKLPSAITSSTTTGLEDPIFSTAEKELENPSLRDSNLLQAEEYFRRGQRDYSNKNYQRAIDAFRASVSFSKRHPIAQYYLDLAIHDAEENAEKNREMAVRYFNTLQFQRAIHHCSEVVALLAHRPEHKSITECNKYIEVSRQRVRAAELVP